MRKVIYRERKWNGVIRGYEYHKDTQAIFHQFTTDYQELEGGVGNYPIALIELENGTVIGVPVDCITFVDRNSLFDSDGIKG
jgi:hypothetical protein